VASARAVFTPPQTLVATAPVAQASTKSHQHAACFSTAPSPPVTTTAHAVPVATSTIKCASNAPHACTAMPYLPTVSAERAVALAKAHAVRMAEEEELAAARRERTNQKRKDAPRAPTAKEYSASGVVDAVTGGSDGDGSANSDAAVANEVVFNAASTHDSNAYDGKGGVDGWKAFQQLHALNKSMKDRDEVVDELADLFGLPGTNTEFVERTLEGAEETFGPELRAQVSSCIFPSSCAYQSSYSALSPLDAVLSHVC
jgi:hypothetical protein